MRHSFGTVRDPANSAMPNTQVTITNQDTGIVYLTKSNAFGEYRSDNLQPGTYMVKIEALGFRDTISVGNIVTVDNNNRVDVSMLVGILLPAGEPVEHQSSDIRGFLPMQKVATIGHDLESIRAAEVFRLAFHRFGPDVVGAAQRQSWHADRTVEP
jgi:Carboxypeptidase regulatory-like domain